MTENELLYELTKELSVPEIETNEVTAKMLAEKLNITPRMAYEILTKKVEAGILKKRYVRGSHQRILAFSKV